MNKDIIIIYNNKNETKIIFNNKIDIIPNQSNDFNL